MAPIDDTPPKPVPPKKMLLKVKLTKRVYDLEVEVTKLKEEIEKLKK